jgi:hypothetical protein
MSIGLSVVERGAETPRISRHRLDKLHRPSTRRPSPRYAEVQRDRHECRNIVIAAVDLFFYDTLFVISPVALVVLGCALFGLLAGTVMLIYLLLRKRR